MAKEPPQLRRPVDQIYPITVPFGVKGPKSQWGRGYHDGTDFGCPKGAVVRAAWGGVIQIAITGNPDYPLGNRIWIVHYWKGLHFRTGYCHLNDVLLVKEGDEVEIGQPIAQSGASGNVRSSKKGGDGAHLHFVLRVGKDGKKSVPSKFFDDKVKKSKKT